MARYKNWLENDHPSYYDKEASVECYVDFEGKIIVILPSEVYLNPDQAEKFGRAIIECAEWRRRNPPESD